ncbi:DNA cytosine methyltransferase [Actinoplanes sp. CA-054009]
MPAISTPETAETESPSCLGTPADTAPAGAKYRIVCADGITYHEPNGPGLLTSMKTAKARAARLATNTDEGACRLEHHIERRTPLGGWETIGKPRAHLVNVGGQRARTRFRVADLDQVANPRAAGYRTRDDGVELTVTDFFCGAGGSSTGMELVPGLRVRMAVNHWADAIETHQHNVPHADHDQADVAAIAKENPYRYPRTDIGWFSPECTFWSQGRGEKVDYDTDWEQPTLDQAMFDPEAVDDDPDKKLAEEAKQRSRALMGDVPRFASVHRYKGIIVENVPDILRWAHFTAWLKRMDTLGYDHKVITLNSAFANALGPGAPQLCDRVYIVFWLKKYRRPDFDKFLRPQAYCPRCDRIVRAMYAPKPGPRRPMRFGAQYVYRCPAKTCRLAEVQPIALPADAILDYSLPTQIIGERKKPIAPKTRARLAGGIWRHRDRFLAAVAGHTFERRPGVRTWPVTRPLVTQQTTEHLGLVVTNGGGWGSKPTRTDEPINTVTTSEKDALALAPPAMVMRNNLGGAEMSTPTDEPIRTLTTAGHQSLVTGPRHDDAALDMPMPRQSLLDAGRAVHAYDTGNLRGTNEPLPTQRTIDFDALVELLSPFIDRCTMRMLAIKEIQKAMDFGDWIQLLGQAKRDKVRMLGNAVTPCAARDLAAALMEAITGVQIDLAPFDPFKPLW